jgi:hypothetical protein
MIKRILAPAATLGALAAIAVLSASPSFALSAKECSVKYNAAKSAGTLNGLTWNEFRKQECGTGAAAATDAKPVVKPSAGTAAATTTAPSGAVFPKAIDPKYAKESAGKARMHTCLDQYHANKASNGNGGLKWIQKGGGYYSLCNKGLKS